MNLENLPALPPLPEDKSHIPFLHASYVRAANPELLEASELLSHQRAEHLGDAFLKILVVDWVMRELPGIGVGKAAVNQIESVLFSNRTFYRIASGYGWLSRIKITNQVRQTEIPKILADTFEAYMGILWERVVDNALSIHTLRAYSRDLVSPAVSATLEEHIEELRLARRVKRAKKASNRNRTQEK